MQGLTGSIGQAEKGPQELPPIIGFLPARGDTPSERKQADPVWLATVPGLAFSTPRATPARPVLAAPASRQCGYRRAPGRVLPARQAGGRPASSPRYRRRRL